MNESILNIFNKLNFYYSEVIEQMPILKNKTFTEETILELQNKINNIINEIPEINDLNSIIEWYRCQWDMNKKATINNLKETHSLSISCLISGHCLALALGIQGYIQINGIFPNYRLELKEFVSRQEKKLVKPKYIPPRPSLYRKSSQELLGKNKYNNNSGNRNLITKIGMDKLNIISEFNKILN